MVLGGKNTQEKTYAMRGYERLSALKYFEALVLETDFCACFSFSSWLVLKRVDWRIDV